MSIALNCITILYCYCNPTFNPQNIQYYSYCIVARTRKTAVMQVAVTLPPCAPAYILIWKLLRDLPMNPCSTYSLHTSQASTISINTSRQSDDPHANSSWSSVNTAVKLPFLRLDLMPKFSAYLSKQGLLEAVLLCFARTLKQPTLIPGCWQWTSSTNITHTVSVTIIAAAILRGGPNQSIIAIVIIFCRPRTVLTTLVCMAA